MSDSNLLLTPDMALFMTVNWIERAVVYKMHLDEAWLKAERVGHFVPMEDPEVVQKVADIIEAQGASLRHYIMDMIRKANQYA